jgi:hypothetical protein
MKIDHAESRECLSLMKWASTVRLDNGYNLGKVLYHIPNGGNRNRIEAGIMKGEGVKAGMMDYHLPIPSQGYASLYLEMKKPIAIPSDVSQEQRERAAVMRDCGNMVHFARNWRHAAEIICGYLDIPCQVAGTEDDRQWELKVFQLIERSLTKAKAA